jgi:hypothetical protein
MRVYLVVVISTAECERIFSRLKLVKTALRNRLSYSLDRILQVALNGPSLAEAMAEGGLIDQALSYFFGRQKRNIRVPYKYMMEKKDVEKLDGIKWGIKVPHPEVIIERKNEVEEGDVEDSEAASLARSRRRAQKPHDWRRQCQ